MGQWHDPMGWQGLRMSACCRILLFNVILNRIKQHSELPQAELKITFDGLRFVGLYVRQVQHRGLSIEVRKCAIQRVEYPCEISLFLRYGCNPSLSFLCARP